MQGLCIPFSIMDQGAQRCMFIQGALHDLLLPELTQGRQQLLLLLAEVRLEFLLKPPDHITPGISHLPRRRRLDGSPGKYQPRMVLA